MRGKGTAQAITALTERSEPAPRPQAFPPAGRAQLPNEQGDFVGTKRVGGPVSDDPLSYSTDPRGRAYKIRSSSARPRAAGSVVRFAYQMITVP